MTCYFLFSKVCEATECIKCTLTLAEQLINPVHGNHIFWYCWDVWIDTAFNFEYFWDIMIGCSNNFHFIVRWVRIVVFHYLWMSLLYLLKARHVAPPCFYSNPEWTKPNIDSREELLCFTGHHRCSYTLWREKWFEGYSVGCNLQPPS